LKIPFSIGQREINFEANDFIIVLAYFQLSARLSQRISDAQEVEA